MKAISLSLLVSLSVLAVVPDHASAAEGSVKSYREWKNDKIKRAQGKLDFVKRKRRDPNLRPTAGVEGRDPGSLRVEQQIVMEQNALEMARELTVSDYFAGYLTRLQDKNGAFKEVAGRLTPEEVAELMAAYANSVFGTQTGNLPPSAQNVGRETVK